MARQIKELSESRDLAMHNETVFHGILNSDLPPSEKRPDRLGQEAQLLVSAGQDTVGQSVISASWFIVILRKDRLNTVSYNVSTSRESWQASKAQRGTRGRYPGSQHGSHICSIGGTPISFCCDSGRSTITPSDHCTYATCISRRSHYL